MIDWFRYGPPRWILIRIPRWILTERMHDWRLDFLYPDDAAITFPQE